MIMSAIYDNWERLVAAVLKREELRELFRADSISVSSSAYSSRISELPSPYHEQSPANYSGVQTSHKNQYLRYNSSAEIVSPQLHFETLRKEKFATTPYRSVADNGITIAVMRLRGSAGISSSSMHENEAYFSSKEDEMLIIYEYQSRDSGLHGKTFLSDWGSRLRIAIALARAIASTHSQCPGNFGHGDDTDDCFSDLALENMAAASIALPTSAYRAPELLVNNSCNRSLESADIYSFGVVLLELLTEKFPLRGNVINKEHLVKWVSREFLESGTLIVFQFVPVGNPKELIQMWKLLLLAIRCVEGDPMQRPTLSEVVKMMEDVMTV